MGLNGPLNFGPYFKVRLPFLHCTSSTSPSNHFGTLFDHCGTQLGLKGPSLTFMGPQMDPKTDPAKLISWDPW